MPRKFASVPTRFIGAWQREKDSDFYDIPFDRNIFFGMVIMNNTFTLSKKHNLKLLVNGMIRSKGIQGNYDLPASGNLDASLRWGFAGGRGLLNIFCSDIFQTSMISPVIDYGGQYVHTSYKGWRRAGVALTWKFGGYTEKRREAVDTGCLSLKKVDSQMLKTDAIQLFKQARSLL